MLRAKSRKIILVLFIVVVLMAGYSYLFRNYLDPELYLELARAHVPYDPYIANWHDPDFELVWQEGRPMVHFVFYCDRKTNRQQRQVTIDPLTKEVRVDGETQNK